MPSVEEMKQIALSFCRLPNVAQMVTIDRDGLPTGRSLGATLNPDNTVDIATINNLGFRRTAQVRRNPAVLFVWQAPPEEGSRVPRTIYAKGRATILSGDAVGDWYDQQKAGGRDFGERTREQAVSTWDIIHCTLTSFRAEGFTRPGEPLDPLELRYGLTWKAG